MSEKEDDNSNEEEIIELHDEIDEEAWSVILRLYDKTSKDLVDK